MFEKEPFYKSSMIWNKIVFATLSLNWYLNGQFKFLYLIFKTFGSKITASSDHKRVLRAYNFANLFLLDIYGL